MNEHYQSQESEHLKLILEYTLSKEQKEKDLTEKLEKVEDENKSLQSQLSTHRETLAAATQDLRSYQTRLGKVEQTVSEHRRDIVTLKERLDVSTSKSKPMTTSLVHIVACLLLLNVLMAHPHKNCHHEFIMRIYSLLAAISSWTLVSIIVNAVC